MMAPPPTSRMRSGIMALAALLPSVSRNSASRMGSSTGAATRTERSSASSGERCADHVSAHPEVPSAGRPAPPPPADASHEQADQQVRSYERVGEAAGGRRDGPAHRGPHPEPAVRARSVAERRERHRIGDGRPGGHADPGEDDAGGEHLHVRAAQQDGHTGDGRQQAADHHAPFATQRPVGEQAPDREREHRRECRQHPARGRWSRPPCPGPTAGAPGMAAGTRTPGRARRRASGCGRRTRGRTAWADRA